MAAAASWQGLSEATGRDARTHPLQSSRGRRGHLRIVGEDDAAVTAPVVRQRVRFTRRGRLVVSATVLLSLVAVVASAVLLMAPAGASSEVVVERGQTLSQLAAVHLPSMPLDRAVVQIQVANGMNTGQIQVGQTLRIPGS